ncbi:MAG: YncE family protein, partial [Thermomicrobiales bacterium]|nr:YncE family protein [Thermomicrobiales bacterium]
MSHTFDLGTRITRRAALKGLAASGAMAGLAWSPLAAQEREVGEGSVSTMPENAQVVPGDVLTVAGTGFAQRPADGYIDFIMDDHLVTTDDGEDIHLEIPGSELDADGNFTVEIPVPLGISEGQHWVRALAGLDGGDPVSKIALFTVVAAATDGTPVAATDAAITGEATAMDDSSVRVRLTGSNLESGAVITAAFGGEPVELSGRGVQPPVTIGDDGSLGVNADIAPGLAPTGDHTLEVTIVGADGTEVVTVPFTVTPFIGLDPTDQGVDTTLTIAALQPGASIESVTAGDLVFETLPAIADDLGIVSLATSLPLELPLGEVEITVTQSAPEAATYTGSASITPSNALFGTEKFVARTAILDASSGQPYQSAYSSVNNAVFVTTAGGQGPGGSNIFKLDADTLEPLGQVAVAEDYPAFGLGLDDANGNVWVTNTRQNTAAIYSQADLSLVQQLGEDVAAHSRDVAVDADLGKVYISAFGDSTIRVFSAVAPFDEIAAIDMSVNDPSTEFQPVSLELDQASHQLFTVSISTPRAAVIDTTADSFTELTYDGSISGSGVAYDPAQGRIFVASQETSNVLVIDVATGDIVANTPTGSGALNVAWDSVNGIAYITNRSAG